eukprot:6196753-Pleurochrysis_carterae.AAC.1
MHTRGRSATRKCEQVCAKTQRWTRSLAEEHALAARLPIVPSRAQAASEWMRAAECMRASEWVRARARLVHRLGLVAGDLEALDNLHRLRVGDADVDVHRHLRQRNRRCGRLE